MCKENITNIEIPLDTVLVALERFENTRGIQCRSRDCVFHTTLFCGLKTVIISKGSCRNYSPNLKSEDVLSEAAKKEKEEAILRNRQG